jgi:hypothetical protein
MTRIGNLFQDPANVLPPYVWEVNHNEEGDQPKRRSIDHTANTAGTGLVRQQGAQTPLILNYSGNFLTENQLLRMLQYFQACETRTIFFTDFDGNQSEVIITSFSAPRLRAAKNPKGGSAAPMWYWKFSVEMEVVRAISGPYVTAGVLV